MFSSVLVTSRWKRCLIVGFVVGIIICGKICLVVMLISGITIVGRLLILFIGMIIIMIIVCTTKIWNLKRSPASGGLSGLRAVNKWTDSKKGNKKQKWIIKYIAEPAIFFITLLLLMDMIVNVQVVVERV